mgnify:CR=1 FL=1
MGIYTREQLLAWVFAKVLQDWRDFGVYAELEKTYPEGLLREVLAIVKQSQKFDYIDKKGAYFMRVLFNRIKEG